MENRLFYLFVGVDYTANLFIFQHRGFNADPLNHGQSDLHLCGNFHTADHHFSISHRRMHISQGENGALMEYGKIKACPNFNALIVHISAVAARCTAVDGAVFRRNTDNPNHGGNIKDKLVIKMNLAVFHLNPFYGFFFHQRAKDAVLRKGTHYALIIQSNFQDFHLEHISCLCILHINRAGGGIDTVPVQSSDTASLFAKLIIKAVMGTNNDGFSVHHLRNAFIFTVKGKYSIVFNDFHSFSFIRFPLELIRPFDSIQV